MQWKKADPVFYFLFCWDNAYQTKSPIVNKYKYSTNIKRKKNIWRMDKTWKILNRSQHFEQDIAIILSFFNLAINQRWMPVCTISIEKSSVLLVLRIKGQGLLKTTTVVGKLRRKYQKRVSQKGRVTDSVCEVCLNLWVIPIPCGIHQPLINLAKAERIKLRFELMPNTKWQSFAVWV